MSDVIMNVNRHKMQIRPNQNIVFVFDLSLMCSLGYSILYVTTYKSAKEEIIFKDSGHLNIPFDYSRVASQTLRRMYLTVH